METKELITLIDGAALKALEFPAGFVYFAPVALEKIPPAQLLELADHYDVEPTRGINSEAIELSIGGPGLCIRVTAIPVVVPVISPRELLSSTAA